MTEVRTVRHGPFMGYVSSIAKDHTPPDAAGPDSRDMRYNPTLGKFIERDGSLILGDSASAPVGLLEQNKNYRCRQIFEYPNVRDQAGNALFADDRPTYGALYDSETYFTFGVNGYGTLYFRATLNGAAANRRAGDGYSSTTYPTTGRSGNKSFMKAMATWHDLSSYSSGTVTAAASASRMGSGTLALRQYLFAGGRRLIQVGSWLYVVGLRMNPMRTNLLYNDSLSAPSKKERWWPMGILPVLFPAWIKAADFPTPDQLNDSWKDGDSFWMTAAYEFEDGTVGPPFIPSTGGGAQVAGGYNDNYGLVTLKSGTPGKTWSYVPWRNIAQPPPGCKFTRLYRSPKVNVNDAPGTVPALTADDGTLNFGLVARIPAGVTSYNDSGGNDVGLLFDSERLRSDHISPPCARYIGAFDGRVCMGYTRSSPQLIYLAHTGTTNPNDNTDDDDAQLTDTVYLVRTTGTSLQLRKATASTSTVTATNTISMSGKTLAEVVALVNATTPASTTGEWRAQLAPGVVGSRPSTDILDSAAAVANYADDGLVGDATTGNQQAFAQGYPATLQLTSAQIDKQPDREGFYFTRGAPQSAAVGVTSAPNFWIAGNYRKPPEYSGIFQGMAPLDNGMVVFYSEKVWLFRNTFSNRSGRDEDYYFALLSDDGCIAWNSIVKFNNAVGWLSRKGYKISGGTPGDERVTTNAIYDPTENKGDLAYEIGKCIISSGSDSDDQRFAAYRFGHVLTIKYRSSASVTQPDFEQEYDFSEGAQSGGLAELVRPDGTPFGWSAPFRRPGETMGEYRGANGLVKLHAIETVGSTGDGRIDQLDVGHQDNGSDISTALYTRMDDQGEIRRRKRERRFSLKFSNPPNHRMTVTHCRDRNRDSATAYTMSNSGNEVVTQVKRIKLAGQAPARVGEYAITGTRVQSAPAEIWMLEREVKVLDTPLDAAG